MTTTAGRARRVRSPHRRLLLGLAYLVPFVAALAVTKPGWVGLSATPGFLHLVSFPLVMGIGWLVCLLVLVPFALVARRKYVAWLTLVALLAAAVNLVTVGVRGAGDDRLALAAGGGVTVLALNTLGGATAAADVARLVSRTDADAVALSETPTALAEQVAKEAAGRGHLMQVFGGAQSPFAVGATSLLVAEDVGRYRMAGQPQTGLGAVVAVPVRGGGPVFAAVHSPPPLGLGAGSWRAGAQRAVDLCRSGRVDVVAGDVNATVDHAPLADLGRCADAADQAGAGAAGTWPARFPPAFATPIDHVFVDAGRWRATEAAVAVAGGSDHRALVVRLRPVAAPA